MKNNNQINKVDDYFSKNSKDWLTRYEKNFQKLTPGDMLLKERVSYSIKCIEKSVQHGGKILDVGCGTGIASVKLFNMGYKITGVDVSNEMINQAREYFKIKKLATNAINLKAGEITNLNLSGMNYDGVLALGFLEYQENPVHVLKHLYNCMNKGGILIISGPSKIKLTSLFGLESLGAKFGKQALKEKILNMIKNLLGKDVGYKKIHSLSINRYSINSLTRFLKSSHFDVIDSTQYGFSSFYILKRFIPMDTQRKISHFLSKIAKKSILHRVADDIIIVAKRL